MDTAIQVIRLMPTAPVSFCVQEIGFLDAVLTRADDIHIDSMPSVLIRVRLQVQLRSYASGLVSG